MFVIDVKAVLIGVVNIKYKILVFVNDRFVVRVELKKKRNNKYIVWVFIKRNNEEVFRGKFIFVVLNEEINLL